MIRCTTLISINEIIVLFQKERTKKVKQEFKREREREKENSPIP